jgi:hypothetical protein
MLSSREIVIVEWLEEVGDKKVGASVAKSLEAS